MESNNLPCRCNSPENIASRARQRNANLCRFISQVKSWLLIHNKPYLPDCVKTCFIRPILHRKMRELLDQMDNWDTLSNKLIIHTCNCPFIQFKRKSFHDSISLSPHAPFWLHILSEPQY